jgi:hypothetical protein
MSVFFSLKGTIAEDPYYWLEEILVSDQQTSALLETGETRQ